MLVFLQKKMTAKQNWAVDQQHSVVSFKVKHLAIANVFGTFKMFNGSVISEAEAFGNAEVNLEINANSIDTNNPERDTHLKSDLFLNTEKFPNIVFNGYIRKINDDYKLDGELTLLGTIKRIVMDVEHSGISNGIFKETRAGFEVSGKINRKDYGLVFHLLNEAGDLVVGNDIKLHCDIELIKQAL